MMSFFLTELALPPPPPPALVLLVGVPLLLHWQPMRVSALKFSQKKSIKFSTTKIHFNQLVLNIRHILHATKTPMYHDDATTFTFKARNTILGLEFKLSQYFICVKLE